jgi:phosphomannomutase
MFGEEYTLVACADYVFKTRNTVSNMSSSRALRDVTNANGTYEASAVGEVL